MKKRAHVLIVGTVQGVFFRSKILIKARKMGVVGWVRNLRDGRVEAIFEGDEDAVNEMIKFCKIGPPKALVKNVEMRWELYTGSYTDFSIKP
jgi:acylphosphatase